MISHHESWWRFFPRNELNQVYLSAALRSVAVSLLGLFVPLYLVNEQGFSLEETLIFFIFYAVVFAVFSPVAAKFSSRFGVKHSVLISIPFYLSFVFSLYLLEKMAFPLVLIAAFLGLSQAFYWMGMNLVFHHASHHQHRGEEVGKKSVITIISTTIGPLLGGLLITLVGFNVVFVLAAILLSLAAVVLFASREEHVPYHFSVRSVLNKRHWKDSLFFVSRGTHYIADGVLWPLFIFVILGSYFSMGLVGSLLSGISALLLLTVGKYSDHVSKRKIIRWTTGIEGLSWIFRAMVSSTGHVFGATIFGAVAYGLRESPVGALEFDKAKGEVAAYFVSREAFICLGRILMLALVLMTNSISGGLIFQGFASLAALIF